MWPGQAAPPASDAFSVQQAVVGSHGAGNAVRRAELKPLLLAPSWVTQTHLLTSLYLSLLTGKMGLAAPTWGDLGRGQ